MGVGGKEKQLGLLGFMWRRLSDSGGSQDETVGRKVERRQASWVTEQAVLLPGWDLGSSIPADSQTISWNPKFLKVWGPQQTDSLCFLPPVFHRTPLEAFMRKKYSVAEKKNKMFENCKF